MDVPGVKLVQVEEALNVVRAFLVECAVQGEWSDHRTAEITDVIRSCFRHVAEGDPQAESTADGRLSRDVLRNAMRFVHNNLDSKLTWTDIAAAVGLDPLVFGRRFKTSTGMTPRQYIIRCRLRRAMNLLTATEASLAEIALEVGCSCQSHMTTLFRKHVGTTPGAFRLRAVRHRTISHESASRASRSVQRPTGCRLGLAAAHRELSAMR